jgi:hypothetical protein
MASAGSKRSIDAGEDERRVQPRHSLAAEEAASFTTASSSSGGAVASSAAGAAASSACSDAAIPFSSPPPHLKLDRILLETILRALSFHELRTALRVSKQWKDVIYTMAPLEEGGELSSNEQINRLLALPSPLARHVTFIGGGGPVDHPMLSIALLHQIATVVPYVRILRFDLLPGAWIGMAFPACWVDSICELYIECPGSRPDEVASLIQEASGVWQLEALGLDCSLMPSEISLKPVQDMPYLAELTLTCDTPRFEDLAQTRGPIHMQQLRAMTQLTQLNADIRATMLLQLLELPGEPLHWIELPVATSNKGRGILTDSMAALLPTVTPHLESFDLECCNESLTDLSFLTHLPALTELVSKPRRDYGRDDELLMTLRTAGLMQCLLYFYLDDCFFTSLDLRDLLACMPQLTELHLRHLEELESLEFLQPVSGSLLTLSIIGCSKTVALPPAQLAILYSLRTLTKLTIMNSFQPLPPAIQRALQAPSGVMPALQTFSYAP